MTFLQSISLFYDNALIYYPNGFFIIMPIISVILLVILGRSILEILLVVYKVTLVEIVKTGNRSKNVVQTYRKSYTTIEKIADRATRYILHIFNAIKKEIFVDE